MRPELKKLVFLDWTAVDDVAGYAGHVDAVLAMKPTSKERRELGRMLAECDTKPVLSTLTGVMSEQPDPVYREPLIKALDSTNPIKRSLAMGGLLRGDYKGALEILFDRPDVQSAMGDALPSELCGWNEKLTESQQRRCLCLFCKRFAVTPPLYIVTHPWLRLLAALTVTNDKVVSILLRVWHELSSQDHYNRYLVLKAMASNPDLRYVPVFKRARRSRIADMSIIARAGLVILAGEID